jgi:YesN/AraC family two-component response regulator
MNNNVLFVDDELHILNAIKRGLRDESFNKFYASSGREAIEILKKGDIHVIVTDMKMPEMTGLELLTYVKDNHPDIVKVILSGYTQLQQILVTINRIDIFKFLTKPFSIRDEFKNVIYSSLEQYNTKKENRLLKESIEKKNEVYQKMIQSNSAKVDVIKKDFRLINKFSYVIGKYMYTLGVRLKGNEISTEKYDDEMEFLLNIQNKFLMMMPMYYKEFTLNELQSEVKKHISNHSDLKVNAPDIFLMGNFDGKYFGNIALLYFSFTKLLLYYFVNSEGMTYNFLINVTKEQEKENMNIVITSSNMEVIIDDTRVKTLEIFFYTIYKFFDGSIEINTERKEVCINLPIEKIK